MSDVEEYFTQMAGTDADKPDATDDAKHDETMGAGQVTDVAGGLERPSFWTDDMEREFRAEVKSLFDDMVGRQQGELSVRDQCEHAYEELTATVNGKYKELTGKDLPASMARNLDQLLTQITMPRSTSRNTVRDCGPNSPNIPSPPWSRHARWT